MFIKFEAKRTTLYLLMGELCKDQILHILVDNFNLCVLYTSFTHIIEFLRLFSLQFCNARASHLVDQMGHVRSELDQRVVMETLITWQVPHAPAWTATLVPLPFPFFLVNISTRNKAKHVTDQSTTVVVVHCSATVPLL
jgi:hypothetical protein